MSFRERIVNALYAASAAAQGNRGGAALVTASAAFGAQLLDRYEAAQPSTPKRSYVPAFNRDARYDANSWSRWEMTRKIRYFERNCWLVQALRDEHVKWTVGPAGLGVNPASSNDEWNKAMLESYQEWCESPVFDQSIDMRQAHKQIAGSCHLENDMFILKTRFKQIGKQARPAIQLIESHRCSAPGTVYSVREDDNIIDGVQLGADPNGRYSGPVGYWIIDNFLGDQWAYRNIGEMLHVFSPERIGMYRGITPYHSVMNTLHDLDDLESMEMDRAKINSEIANIITTPSGELNKDASRQKRYGQTATSTPIPDSKDEYIDSRIQLYRKILGARTIALKTGEGFEQVGSESPSASSQWYWKYKLGQVSKTVGVPLILIFPELIEGMQGTVVRGIYDDAHETFKGYFYQYAVAAIKLYQYYAQWAIFNDPRCINHPPDWNKCHVVPPRAVNVDIGYTSQAVLAELEAGVTNFDDIAGRLGTTAAVLITKKAKNVALIHKIAAQEGVEPGEISAPIAEVMQQLALAQQTDSGEEDEDVNKKKKPAVKGKDKKK